MESNINVTNQRKSKDGNLNPMWGKKQSYETKQKISDTQRKRYQMMRQMVKQQQEQKAMMNVMDSPTFTNSVKQIVREELEKRMNYRAKIPLF
jgi:SRSO17 transposase